MASRAAIVLAGGSGQRFQTQNRQWQDKALAQIKGTPLIVHVIRNLESVVDDLIVCVNDEKRKAKYNQVLEKYGLKGTRFVIDEKNHSIKGPLLAVLSGLHAVSSKYCLTVPTDMPFLKPKVAEYLLDSVESFDVAVPMWPDGTLETLIMAVKKENCIEITETLCALNKSRADATPRAASKLLLVSPLREIKTIDPELKSFININCQEDLTKLGTRNTEGAVNENITLTRGMRLFSDLHLLRDGQRMLNEGKTTEAQTTFVACADSFEAHNVHFWSGISAEKLTEATRNQSTTNNTSFLRAAKNYQAEAKTYQEKGCRLLAERALSDMERCESKVA
jgi:molybdopterin-guanine dinucleotide biosynthesis protein A